MTLTINLPGKVVANLNQRASKQHITPETLAAQILEDALQDVVYKTPEEVIERIKRLPRDPSNIRPATVSLADLLANAPEDPDFDLAEWQRQWELVEQEMKAVERADREADRERDGLDY